MLQNPVPKCENTEAQKGNLRLTKMYENQPLKYSSMQNKDGYKLQVQVAGSPTNISAVAKTRTSK